ncbi:DUF5958 family protein [Streptomyces sp. S1]|uniref:DUF5958 family protein n=1 Tax=Streptomyces sp. S1 TaxID=718288 RepID=UPI003F4A52A0
MDAVVDAVGTFLRTEDQVLRLRSDPMSPENRWGADPGELLDVIRRSPAPPYESPDHPSSEDEGVATIEEDLAVTVTKERDVLLNELAQGLRPMPEGIEWLDGLAPEEQTRTPRFPAHHRVQARALAEDGPESISRAGLPPTHTPAVLIARGRIDRQPGKIACLAPLAEHRKAFRLLISVLAIADGRRRERYCSGGCGHWWHGLSVARQPGTAL